ncbi:hypothetical protein PQX77_006931 [Marasmius sp. AFHP31]|nr:hypothetical protein PQX77_006931 [Marasmius sp. AFHP31]
MSAEKELNRLRSKCSAKETAASCASIQERRNAALNAMQKLDSEIVEQVKLVTEARHNVTAIQTSLALPSPSSQRAKNGHATYPPRFIYPDRRETYHFKLFAETADRLTSEAGLQHTLLESDEDYDSLYHQLTDIIHRAATSTFQKLTPFTPKRPSSPRLQLLLREFRRLSRIITAIKHR